METILIIFLVYSMVMISAVALVISSKTLKINTRGFIVLCVISGGIGWIILAICLIVSCPFYCLEKIAIMCGSEVIKMNETGKRPKPSPAPPRKK